MSKKIRRCCICGKELPKGDLGNNPEPVMPYSSGTCCSKCNMEKVIPARLSQIASGTSDDSQAKGDADE